jgi:hypothetical protein
MRERERLAKIYQTWLVKIAKMGGEWWNEFGRALGRVTMGNK